MDNTATDIFSLSNEQFEQLDTDAKLPEDTSEQGEEQETTSIDEGESSTSGTSEDTVDSGEEEGEAPEETDSSSDVEVDASEFMSQILAPFKANGTEISVKSAEEAIRLMQMGAGFTKKNQEYRKLQAMQTALADSGIKTQDDLNIVMAAYSGDKKAIAALLTKNGIEAFDLEDSEEAYQAPNRLPSDNVVRFQQEISTVMEAPEGVNLIQNIKDTWDEASIQQLQDNENSLNYLLDQYKSGIYTKITSEIARREALGTGNFKNMAEAYITVGQELTQQGKLQVNEAKAKPKAKAKAATKPKAGVSVPKGSRSAPAPSAEVDVFSLSEDDFNKLTNQLKVKV